MPGNGNQVPSAGDQVEQWHNGVRRVGRVWYSDDLQVLVKWDDGRSSRFACRPGQVLGQRPIRRAR